MKYTQILKAIDTTSQHLVGRAAAAVNQAFVIRNWLIGTYIVEFDQTVKPLAAEPDHHNSRRSAMARSAAVAAVAVATCVRKGRFRVSRVSLGWW